MLLGIVCCMAHMDAQITRLICHYSAGRGISKSYASKLLTGNGDTVTRMLRGMSLTGRRAEKIIATASRCWPDDISWPDGIPRPSPTSTPKEVA